MAEALDIVAEPANKATTMASSIQLERFENQVYRSGSSSISLLDEVYIIQSCGFAFPPFSPFFETFNAKIDQMISNGIIDHERKMQNDPKLATIEESEAQVITLEDLGLGFEICLISMAISLTAFIIELLIDFITSRIYRMCKKKIEQQFFSLI